MMPTPTHYDVFLSHNSADKPAVEELARRLVKEGIRPWLDRWNLIPGEKWQEAIETALQECDTCAVFIGPSGIGPWHHEEMRAALDRAVRTRDDYRVIPVLLPDTPVPERGRLPPFLSRLTWVDFRKGLEDADAFHRLTCGIRGIAPGGPDLPPSFDPLGTVLTRLRDASPDRRSAAARELGGRGEPRFVPIIEQYLVEEDDPSVRYWLALSLGQIGGDDAIAVLLRAVEREEDLYARLGITDALQKAGYQSVPPLVPPEGGTIQ